MRINEQRRRDSVSIYTLRTFLPRTCCQMTCHLPQVFRVEVAMEARAGIWQHGRGRDACAQAYM